MSRFVCATCLAMVVVAVIAALAQRDDASVAAPTPAAATPSPAASPTATPAGPPAAGQGLAIGVTEPNPNLVAAPAARAVPPPWSGWRDALGAIRPAYYRLVIDWASIQPSPGVPADLSTPNAGCMRELSPCLGWAGVREQLRALASRQREGGWQGLVVLTGTPDWAAAPPSGCERDGTTPHSRPPRADALSAYQKLVADVLAAAAQEGADLHYWSAWNEPNHPAFVSPQRGACDSDSPTAAAAPYADLVRALQAALSSAGGDHQIVLGETAGLLKPTARTSSVQEFIAALPQDVVCASTVWSQHGYIGGPDPVGPVADALAARGCPQPHTIWMTETGVGPAPSDLSGARAIAGEQEGCRELHDRLVTWWNDPRVTVVFQYTFRQDDRFPTGLITTDLTAARPTLAEWTAWGGARRPAAPPPQPAC
ncbi:hypothetical protein [Candidatus Solirubrobacter pratensis]|uniref:hypothetical protein n=1 Tax=Candidatus Solirubrobacter pratensis TaxID=1298857 RepID=UPI000424D651|nr:hypothetical protein [Candidatus Solirubrobacter pratensis]